MSYMTENPASKFYHGVAPPEDQLKKIEHDSHGHEHEAMHQKVINYCIVQPRYEQKIPRTGFFSDDDDNMETRAIIGSRLVGIIPCSDARGYDILIKDFRDAEARQKKIKEQEMKVMKDDDNF